MIAVESVQDISVIKTIRQPSKIRKAPNLSNRINQIARRFDSI